MKRAAFIVTGALTLLVLGTIFISLLPGGYVGQYIHSDDDMNFVVGILLGVWTGLLVIGGWLGNHLYKKHLTRHSSGSR